MRNFKKYVVIILVSLFVNSIHAQITGKFFTTELNVYSDNISLGDGDFVVAKYLKNLKLPAGGLYPDKDYRIVYNQFYVFPELNISRSWLVTRASYFSVGIGYMYQHNQISLRYITEYDFLAKFSRSQENKTIVGYGHHITIPISFTQWFDKARDRNASRVETSDEKYEMFGFEAGFNFQFQVDKTVVKSIDKDNRQNASYDEEENQMTKEQRDKNSLRLQSIARSLKKNIRPVNIMAKLGLKYKFDYAWSVNFGATYMFLQKFNYEDINYTYNGQIYEMDFDEIEQEDFTKGIGMYISVTHFFGY